MTHVWMKSLFMWGILICPLSAIAVPQETPETKSRYRHVLGKSVERLLDEEAIPALQQGYGDYFFESIAPVIQTLNTQKLISLEELAKKLGVDSIQNEFVKVLIQRIKRGTQVPDSIRKFDLAEYVAKGITNEIRLQLDEIGTTPIMSDELLLPSQGLKTDRLFWDAHVVNNRLKNLAGLATYSKMIAQPHIQRYKDLKPEKQDAAQRQRIKQLERSLQISADVAGARKTLVLNAAEYRLLDLNRAVAKLQLSDEFESRLLAAWTLEDSAQLLIEFLKNASPSDLASRARLSRPDLLATIEEQYKLGLSYGKDVVDKANLLRLGSFWWLRGRYGSASMAKGLLKDRGAMDSEYLMIGLFMPKSPDKPICSFLSNEDRIEGYDRRHFYTWAVEYREKRARSKSGSRNTTLASKVDSTQVSQKTTFW